MLAHNDSYIHANQEQKKSRRKLSNGIVLFVHLLAMRLSTQTKGFNYRTIAFNVAVVQIIKQCTALTYKHSKRPSCSMILTVLLKVFRQMGNTVGEQCYLALC